VEAMDESITKVEIELVKNKYSGMVNEVENQSDELGEVLKARMDKIKKQDSCVKGLVS
jgi:hypothetical protein